MKSGNTGRGGGKACCYQINQWKSNYTSSNVCSFPPPLSPHANMLAVCNALE